MKVLFINRPKESWVGGDYVQMERTAEELRKLGVEVDISETPLISPAMKMMEYDIVHVWNFSMTWSKFGVWAGAKWKRKVVASMIYHEGETFVPFPHQQVMLDHTDACVFLSNTEIDRVRRHLKIKESQIHVIPNGIDSFFFKGKRADKQDKVLTVGRIEADKGQLGVAKACKELGIPYLCIGSIQDKGYADLLRAEGALLFTSLPQKELIPYYAECKVHALISKAEIFPLTAMEAGAQGCNLVLTTHCEWKPEGEEYAEYDNVETIKDAITKAMAKPYNEKLKTNLKKMTWKKVAKSVKKVYENILLHD
jgi:glycosyltransferase involved in cell wall biosynthesis